MVPQRYQVLLPGTWSLTLFGERVFANMTKWKIFKWRDHPRLSEQTLNATTGKWEAEGDSTGTEENEMRRQSRERVDDAGFEEWSDMVTSEGVTCSHLQLEETGAGFYLGACSHANTLISAHWDWLQTSGFQNYERKMARIISHHVCSNITAATGNECSPWKYFWDGDLSFKDIRSFPTFCSSVPDMCVCNSPTGDSGDQGKSV